MIQRLDSIILRQKPTLTIQEAAKNEEKPTKEFRKNKWKLTKIYKLFRKTRQNYKK